MTSIRRLIDNLRNEINDGQNENALNTLEKIEECVAEIETAANNALEEIKEITKATY